MRVLGLRRGACGGLPATGHLPPDATTTGLGGVMIPLTLPPFDYVAHGPYIISVETWSEMRTWAHDTLQVSICEWLMRAVPDEPRHIKRCIDARGVTIMGLDTVNPLGSPRVAMTSQVFDQLNALAPQLTETIEAWEMLVREQYTWLKGGT